MKVVMGQRINVPSWTARDFTAYYMFKYRESMEDPTHEFPKETWLMWSAHIKRFMKKLRLTNEDYKEYIDFLFSPKFKARGIIGFMAIVNEKLYYRYNIVKQSKIKKNPHVTREATDEEVASIRKMIDDLYDRMK